MPRLRPEIYEEIIEDYQSGLTQNAVGELHGIGRNAIHNILVRFNVPIRGYTGERDSNRKWVWDFDFFYRQTMNTAYWAGFIMADGNIKSVGKNSFSVCVCVKKSDTEHVKKLCRDVDLDWKSVHIRKDKGEPDIRLNHVSLLKQLEPWGIVPRKTYNFVEPQVSELQ